MDTVETVSCDIKEVKVMVLAMVNDCSALNSASHEVWVYAMVEDGLGLWRKKRECEMRAETGRVKGSK